MDQGTAGTASGDFGFFLRQLSDLEQKGPTEWWARCPAHADRGEPNLHITWVGDRALLYCHRCGATAPEILDALGLEWSALFESDRQPPPRPRSVTNAKADKSDKPTLALLAERIGVEPDFLRSLGWREERGGVAVPYRDEQGQVVAEKLRMAMDGKPKYIYVGEDREPVPFGLDRLPTYRSTHRAVVLCEGETDAAALWSAGVPALGIPGASTLKCLTREHLNGIVRAFVIQEPDDAGREFVHGRPATEKRAAKLGAVEVLSSWGIKVAVVELPAGIKDPAALRARDPEKFPKLMRELIRDAGAGRAPKPSDGFVRLDTVKEKTPEWLWAPRIPRGGLTILAGHGGMGKSCILSSLIAGVTTGVYNKDRRPGTVLLFAAEDALDSVVRPRIEKSGGDLSRVYAYAAIEEAGFGLRRDLPRLEALVEELKPDLVAFDPIVAFHEGDMIRANVVRMNLGPLARIARVHALAMLLVAHMAKGERSAEQSISGSMDFWSAARSVLQTWRDPAADGLPEEARGVLAHAKANTSYLARSLRYVIVDGVVQWCDESPFTASQLAQSVKSATPGEAMQLRDVKIWLRDALRSGPLPANVVRARARAQGITDKVLNDARAALNVPTELKNWASVAGPDGDASQPGANMLWGWTVDQVNGPTI